MARYIIEEKMKQPLDVVSLNMEDYIYHNRFKRTDWNGEPVYVSLDEEGKERYFNWSYACGVLRVEAWFKGPFGEESDLDGIGNTKDKKEYRDSVDALVLRIKNHCGHVQGGDYIGADPMQHNPNHPCESKKPIYYSSLQKEKAQNAGKIFSSGLMFGICSLMCSGFGVVGMVFAILGLRNNKRASAEGMDYFLILARICCIIGAVSSIINFFKVFFIGFGY